MDIWQLIINDHRNIAAQFEQVLGAIGSGARSRDPLFDQLKLDLDRHTKAEEDVLYPALKRHDETRRYVDEALREHQEAKRMLTELATGDKDSAEWTARLRKLQQAIQHHVDEEEKQIIPAARNVITGNEASELRHAIERDMIATLQEGA